MRNRFWLSKYLFVLYIVSVFCCLECGANSEDSHSKLAIDSPLNNLSKRLAALPKGKEYLTRSRKYKIEQRKLIHKLLLKESYDELEDLGDRILASEEGYPSGISKIDTYAYYLAYSKRIPSVEDLDKRAQVLKKWLEKRPKSVYARLALAFIHTHLAELDENKERNLILAEKFQNETVDSKKKYPVWYSSYVSLFFAKKSDIAKIFEEEKSWHTLETRYKTAQILLAGFLPIKARNAIYNFEDYTASVSNQVGSKDGDVLYSRIVWRAQTRMDCFVNVSVFKELQLDWTRVFNGYEILLTRYPDSVAVLNAYARSAILDNNKKLARKLFEQIGSRADLDTWIDLTMFENARKWVYAGPRN